MFKKRFTYYLIFSIAILAFNNVKSQTYSFNPNKAYVIILDTNQNDFGGIEILNTGTQDLNLTWRLLLKDTLIDSRFELCNSGICFLNLPYSGAMPTITPGNVGWLKLHMYPGTTTGTNTITYVLKNGGIQSDTLTFTVIVDANVTGFKELSTIKKISLYPNPAKNSTILSIDLVQTENVTVNVVNTIGQVVHSQTLTNASAGAHEIKLNADDWATGVYNVNITVGNGKVNRKLVINK